LILPRFWRLVKLLKWCILALSPHFLDWAVMQEISFTVDGEYVELNQLLKLVGVCDSGGAGKVIVASGAVRVDGKQELRKTAKIRPGQKVQLSDVCIKVVA
jgi:ribosome-associated protein